MKLQYNNFFTSICHILDSYKLVEFLKPTILRTTRNSDPEVIIVNRCHFLETYHCNEDNYTSETLIVD